MSPAYEAAGIVFAKAPLAAAKTVRLTLNPKVNFDVFSSILFERSCSSVIRSFKHPSSNAAYGLDFSWIFASSLKSIIIFLLFLKNANKGIASSKALYTYFFIFHPPATWQFLRQTYGRH